MPEDLSLRVRCRSPGGQVPPRIGPTDGVQVIRGVAGINLPRAMPFQKGAQSLIQQGSVSTSWPEAAGVLKEFGVHSRAHAFAIHGLTLPFRVTKVDG